MAKKFTVILDDDEINAVKELIKTTDIHSLLSSHETSVNYGILYQILAQDTDDTQGVIVYAAYKILYLPRVVSFKQ